LAVAVEIPSDGLFRNDSFNQRLERQVEPGVRKVADTYPARGLYEASKYKFPLR
jgi:hypothetical protein